MSGENSLCLRIETILLCPGHECSLVVRLALVAFVSVAGKKEGLKTVVAGEDVVLESRYERSNNMSAAIKSTSSRSVTFSSLVINRESNSGHIAL